MIIWYIIINYYYCCYLLLLHTITIIIIKPYHNYIYSHDLWIFTNCHGFLEDPARLSFYSVWILILCRFRGRFHTMRSISTRTMSGCPTRSHKNVPAWSFPWTWSINFKNTKLYSMSFKLSQLKHVLFLSFTADLFLEMSRPKKTSLFFFWDFPWNIINQPSSYSGAPMTMESPNKKSPYPRCRSHRSRPKPSGSDLLSHSPWEIFFGLPGLVNVYSLLWKMAHF